MVPTSPSDNSSYLQCAYNALQSVFGRGTPETPPPKEPSPPPEELSSEDSSKLSDHNQMLCSILNKDDIYSSVLREFVAKNLDEVSYEIVTKILEYPDLPLAKGFGQNSDFKITNKILNEVTKDLNTSFAEGVGLNSTLDTEKACAQILYDLDKLELNLNSNFAFSLGQNPSLKINDEILSIVRKYPNSLFAKGVGLNPKLEINDEILNIVREYPNSLFAKGIGLYPNLEFDKVEDILDKHPQLQFSQGIGLNPNLKFPNSVNSLGLNNSPPLKKAWSRHHSYWTQGITSSALLKINEDILKMAEKDPNTYFALGIGLNPNLELNDQVIKIIKEKPHSLLVYGIVQNPNLKINDDFLDLVLKEENQTILESISKNPNSSLAKGIGLNPNIEIEKFKDIIEKEENKESLFAKSVKENVQAQLSYFLKTHKIKEEDIKEGSLLDKVRKDISKSNFQQVV